MTFFPRLSRTLLVVALSSLAALISPCAAPSASALEAGDIVLQVSPAEQEIDLAPSQTYTGSFTLEVTVSAADVAVSLAWTNP